MLMFDGLDRHLLAPYADTVVDAAARAAHPPLQLPAQLVGPLEPFDDSMPEILGEAGLHTHLVSDHPHYGEGSGATYRTRYTTWQFFRGQEDDPWKGVVDGLREGEGPALRRQDAVNRAYMQTEDTAQHDVVPAPSDTAPACCAPRARTAPSGRPRATASPPTARARCARSRLPGAGPAGIIPMVGTVDGRAGNARVPTMGRRAR
ncbi:hypothetical protein AB0910_00740 [Streptomyces sp. NPDC047002]|uniref:hypothetical protein n=1 Tax=Streptomyces sp. NPDC047002 TaxID=3155475 RepID=UPI003453C8CF